VSFSRAGAAFMAPAGFLSVTPHPHPCPKRERVGILLAPTPLCPKHDTRAFHLFLSQPPGHRRLAFGAGEGSPPLLQMRGDGGIYCFVFLANFPFGTLLISHRRPRGASSPYYPPASSSDAPSLLTPLHTKLSLHWASLHHHVYCAPTHRHCRFSRFLSDRIHDLKFPPSSQCPALPPLATSFCALTFIIN
jgi:hypothetical protein